MTAFPLLGAWKKRALPTFLLLGAQKAGTTTLHHFLKQHPQMRLPAGKLEVHYFDRHFGRGVDWYLNHFPYERELIWRKPRPLVGEKTPYYLVHPLAPERARRLLPDAKMIVLLRDPVKRAISHYFHSFRKGYETLDMASAFAAEPERLAGEMDRLMLDPTYVSDAHRRFSYATRGLYREQIDRWLAEFPLDRFLFIRSEELLARPDRTFGEVCNFLGVREIALSDYPQRNVGGYGGSDQAIVRTLRARFEEPNKRLADLLGPDFDFNAALGTGAATETVVPKRAKSARR